MSLCLLRIFLTRYNVLLTELQDLGGTLQDQNQERFQNENTLQTNGISWISASSRKLLQRGERDFELAWLQEEDSLHIRHEHFSLLTFCYVLFLKARLFVG